MKKVFASLTFPVALLATFVSYEKKEMSKNSLEQLVLENIEAMTAPTSNQKEVGLLYEISSGKCPPPCNKSWVTCKRGGNYECLPSDCC